MSAAFAVTCRDAPGSDGPRRERLQAHLDHVERVMDRILIAGPLKDEEGAATGSLLILAADSAAEARALIEADPYFEAGVWDEIEVERFLPVAGTLVGGRKW